MIGFLCIAGLSSMFLASYLRYRDLLYPPVLQSASWLAVVSIFLMNEEAFGGLSAPSYFIFLNGAFMFALGNFLVTYRFEPRQTPMQFQSDRSGWFLNGMLALSIVGLPLMYFKAQEIGGHGQTGIFLLDLREQLTTGKGSYGIIGYLITFAIACAGLHFVTPPVRLRKTRQITATAVALGYAVLATGRTYFLVLVVLTGGVLLIKRNVKPMRSILSGLCIMLGVFVLFAVLLHKGGDERATVSDNVISLWQWTRVYVIGSLAAFDRLSHTTNTLAWGDNVFRTIWAVLYSLGFDTQPVPLQQPYIKTPILTNVYTVYQPYFLDFSYVGAVLIQFLLGMLHGHIYKRAVSGSAFFVALYALSLYPLVMQFFQDQYLNLLSTWVQFAAVLGMFVWICRPRTLVAGNAPSSMIAFQGDCKA